MDILKSVINTPTGTHKYHGVSITIDRSTLLDVLGPVNLTNSEDTNHQFWAIHDSKTGNGFVLLCDPDRDDLYYVFAQSLVNSLGCGGNICKRISNNICRLYNVSIEGRNYNFSF